MLFSIKNRDDLESLDELVQFQSQVREIRVKYELGKQVFHEDLKKYLNLSLKQSKMSLNMQQKKRHKPLNRKTKHLLPRRVTLPPRWRI